MLRLGIEMTITYHPELEQGSLEWMQLRCGIITASEMKRVVSLTDKPTKADKKKVKVHLYELLAQRLNSYVEPQYVGDAMLRGHEDEIYACIAYEKNIAPIEKCGFITNDEWGFTIGYSPDGLVGDDGLIECKSRIQKYQTETIITQEVPEEYVLQLQTGLLVSGRKWIDFISYSGGMPMFVKRVLPDLEMQEIIIRQCKEFEADLQAELTRYQENSKGLILTERRVYEEIV